MLYSQIYKIIFIKKDVLDSQIYKNKFIKRLF